MRQAPYMLEPWFAMLQAACEGKGRQAEIARRLGYSAPAVGQVLNGTGAYGSGKASTAKLAQRVQDTLGGWPCPHLEAEGASVTTIHAAKCRAMAHRPAPTGSPRDLAHWRACQACPMRSHSEPPPDRPATPRKSRRLDNKLPTPTTEKEQTA